MPISEHPVVVPGAVPVNTLAEEIIDPLDQGIVVHVAGDSALSGAAPAPGAPTTITASVTLPAAGAMETAPSGSSAGVAVPVGTVGNPTRGGTVIVLYTQGAGGGEEAGLVWGWDGAEWVIIMGPGDPYVDAVYSGIPLGVGTGNYSLPFENKNGFTRIAYTGQEKGVTATPGTHVVKVVFD